MLAVPSDPSTGQTPLSLVRRQILPSTKQRCLELAPSHSQQPFLSLCSLRTGEVVSWAVLTLRNWVGPGEPFGLGQAARPRSLAGNSI